MWMDLEATGPVGTARPSCLRACRRWPPGAQRSMGVEWGELIHHHLPSSPFTRCQKSRPPQLEETGGMGTAAFILPEGQFLFSARAAFIVKGSVFNLSIELELQVQSSKWLWSLLCTDVCQGRGWVQGHKEVASQPGREAGVPWPLPYAGGCKRLERLLGWGGERGCYEGQGAPDVLSTPFHTTLQGLHVLGFTCVPLGGGGFLFLL